MNGSVHTDEFSNVLSCIVKLDILSPPPLSSRCYLTVSQTLSLEECLFRFNFQNDHSNNPALTIFLSQIIKV